MGDLPQEDKRVQILEQLENSSRTMERFLEDLLDGLTLNHTELQRVPVRLDECINEVIAGQLQRATERGIRIHFLMPKPVPAVAGDRHRLFQVIDNLVGNAVKHMGEKSDSRITIHLFEDENAVITKVSDNGVGIAVQHQAKIFDRFYRVSGTRERTGTGLGLSIVRKIVESHGGEIALASDVQNGATFTVKLPKATTVEKSSR